MSTNRFARRRVHATAFHLPETLERRQLLSVVTYDLNSQWSDAHNPNGAWTYREGNNALPHLANWQPGSFNGAQQAWARAGAGTGFLPAWFKSSVVPTYLHDWQTGDVVVHDWYNGPEGTGNGPANVIWTSPAAGTVTISGAVWMGRDIGRHEHWALMKNSTVLTGGDIFSGDAFSRANPFKYGAGSGGAAAVQNIPVVKGDVIQLRLTIKTSTDIPDFIGVKLTVAETVPNTGTVSGSVFTDINGNGTKDGSDAGRAGVKVFVDSKVKNGVLDAGEPSATTSSTGSYSITGVPTGAFPVIVIPPSGFRASTTNPVNVTVSGGGTSNASFGVSTTVVISGNVFNDANGNKIKDSGEAGQSGVTVYLDLNNNGVLDFIDLKTTTDASGNYKFVVPFGTYTIREVAPNGFALTTAVKTLTIGSGKLSTGNNVGNNHT